MPTLSAWETLHFHAILRTPRGITRAEITHRMEDTLAVMGLSRSAHTQVRLFWDQPILAGRLPGCPGMPAAHARMLHVLQKVCTAVCSPAAQAL